MAWVLLVVAGVFETAFAVSLKNSEGFSRLWWTLSFVVFAAASFGLLTIALRTLPVGTAYAVWTGIGAVGAFVFGIVTLGEPLTPLRVLAASQIVSGILLMKFAAGD